MQQQTFSEKRRQARTRASDKVLWRKPGSSEFEPGWMLEHSESGLAFAWRGQHTPSEGDRIQIQRSHSGHDSLPESALVRRVAHAHEDLFVIGVEIVHNTPAHYVAAESSLIEPRPSRLKLSRPSVV
ncbi:MAG: hypothetical protein IPJ41_10930 [Phycisphaerales bacterium]|nr:hypothetical protein [Phycisphaerales bacterium]